MIKNCITCDNEFDTRTRNNDYRAITCCAECSVTYRKKYHSIKRKESEARNKEHRRAYQNEWRRKNLQKFAAKERRRRARKYGDNGHHSARQVYEMWIAQKWRCAACRTSIEDKFHVDHIVPLSLGGSNNISNIQLLCAFCNISKGAKPPEIWAQKNGRLL